MFGFGSKRNGNGKTNGHHGNGRVHLIDLHEVAKTFQTPAGEFIALKGVDLHIDEGEFVSIIGKSGSGKSTLINMITGIDRPTSGEVWVGGADVRHLDEGQMAIWRGRTVGVVFQFFQLLPTLTAIENVTLPMDFVRAGLLAERRQRAMHLLELVGMADQAHELPSALSGGQQQSVAIARALANDSPIIAADAVFQLFERLVEQGKTILVVTHDNDLAKRARRTIKLADGEIVGDENESLAPRAVSGQRSAIIQSK